MRKDDLRNGMVVKTKSNKYHFIFNCKFYDPWTMKNNIISLSDYDDNLKRYFGGDDIIEVYSNLEIIYNDVEPIWMGNVTDWSTVEMGTKVRARDKDCEWVEGTLVQYKTSDKHDIRYPFDVLLNEPNQYGYRDIMPYEMCELID